MSRVVGRTFGELGAIFGILSEVIRLLHSFLLCQGHRRQGCVYNAVFNDTFSTLMNSHSGRDATSGKAEDSQDGFINGEFWCYQNDNYETEIKDKQQQEGCATYVRIGWRSGLRCPIMGAKADMSTTCRYF
jgi:hypothetical protein